MVRSFQQTPSAANEDDREISFPFTRALHKNASTRHLSFLCRRETPRNLRSETPGQILSCNSISSCVVQLVIESVVQVHFVATTETLTPNIASDAKEKVQAAHLYSQDTFSFHQTLRPDAKAKGAARQHMSTVAALRMRQSMARRREVPQENSVARQHE